MLALQNAGRRSERRLFLIGLLSIALMSCGSPRPSSPPPGEQLRQQFGVVGIRIVDEKPPSDFDTPLRGRASGAAKGAGVGALQGAVAALGQRDPLSSAIALVVFVPLGIVVGGIAGATEAVSESEAQAIDAQLAAALSGVAMAEEIREGIDKTLRDRVTHPVVMLSEGSAETIDSILEVHVQRAGLTGGGGSDPMLSVFVDVDIRLVRAADGTLLYEDRALQFTGARPFSQWAHNKAEPVRLALIRACRATGEAVIEEVFLKWSPT